MPRDLERAREARRLYRERKKIEKYGPGAAGTDMRGKHGNHAKGSANGRWNPHQRRRTSHGYMAVRVPVDHPHAWGPPGLKRFKYAYEHVVMMMKEIGRPLRPNEVVHHRNGDTTDNRLENLELTTASEHQRYHTTETRERDRLGRFA